MILFGTLRSQTLLDIVFEHLDSNSGIPDLYSRLGDKVWCIGQPPPIAVTGQAISC